MPRVWGGDAKYNNGNYIIYNRNDHDNHVQWWQSHYENECNVNIDTGIVIGDSTWPWIITVTVDITIIVVIIVDNSWTHHIVFVTNTGK